MVAREVGLVLALPPELGVVGLGALMGAGSGEPLLRGLSPVVVQSAYSSTPSLSPSSLQLLLGLASRALPPPGGAPPHAGALQLRAPHRDAGLGWFERGVLRKMPLEDVFERAALDSPARLWPGLAIGRARSSRPSSSVLALLSALAATEKVACHHSHSAQAALVTKPLLACSGQEVSSWAPWERARFPLLGLCPPFEVA